jgi:hypothetical protein
MKRKIFPKLVIALTMLTLILGWTMALKADDSVAAIETVRSQLINIAKFMNTAKHWMNSGSGAVVGNVIKGNAGWGCSDYLDRAVGGAFGECNKNGGGCEELFTVCIQNFTSKTVKIYLYVPWETNFPTSNALWSWTWPPGHESNLAVENCLLFVPKSLYFAAEYEDGSKDWATKKMSELNFTQRNYRDGQNLWLRLIDVPN